MSQYKPYSSEHYRLLAREKRVIGDAKITLQGRLDSYDIADAYDKIAADLAVAEQVMREDAWLLRELAKR